MRRRVPVTLAFAVLAALAALGACAVYDSSLLVSAAPVLDAAPPDAGVDADAEAVCTHAVAPPVPASQNSQAENEYIFAADSLRLDALPDDGGIRAPTGLDLDMTCTCPGPATCLGVVDGGPSNCDGPEGRDQGSVTVFSRLASVTENFRPSFIRGDVAKGNYTLIFRLTRYNGEDDDRDVGLAVYPSNGTEGVQNGNQTVPKFDGTDVWTVDPLGLLDGPALADAGASCATAADGCRPVFVAESAFVRGGKLWARIDVPISVTGAIGMLSIDLVGGGIEANIDRSGAVLRLVDVQITGRWPIDRILKNIGTLKDPFTSEPMCTGGGTVGYKPIKQVLCESLDVGSDRTKDGTNLPCDALSTAIAASAVQAKLGTVYRRDSLPPPCPTFTDHCP